MLWALFVIVFYIASYFMPKELIELESSMDEYFSHFNEYRSLMSDWKSVGVHHDEIGTLLSIFNKLENESKVRA